MDVLKTGNGNIKTVDIDRVDGWIDLLRDGLRDAKRNGQHAVAEKIQYAKMALEKVTSELLDVPTEPKDKAPTKASEGKAYIT